MVVIMYWLEGLQLLNSPVITEQFLVCIVQLVWHMSSHNCQYQCFVYTELVFERVFCFVHIYPVVPNMTVSKNVVFLFLVAIVHNHCSVIR